MTSSLVPQRQCLSTFNRRARRSAPASCRVALVGLAATLSTGCSDDLGTIEVRAYGESFIEAGIPAPSFADGWAVTFERFEQRLANITLANEMVGSATVDLAVDTGGQGQGIAAFETTAGAYIDAAFSVVGFHVVGTAARDTEQYAFDWTFDETHRYYDCETTTVVTPNGLAVFEITTHADHLFYDSLVADAPALRFDALAQADERGNADHAITTEELQAAGIGAYDPGNADIGNLWSWLEAQVRSLPHVDGEGHCLVGD